MAATIKIVKKRTTRFKCVHLLKTLAYINPVPGVTNLTATRASRRTGGNQRGSITESVDDSKVRLLCPRSVNAPILPYPRLNILPQIGYGSNKKVSQSVDAFRISTRILLQIVDTTPPP